MIVAHGAYFAKRLQHFGGGGGYFNFSSPKVNN